MVVDAHTSPRTWHSEWRGRRPTREATPAYIGCHTRHALRAVVRWYVGGVHERGTGDALSGRDSA